MISVIRVSSSLLAPLFRKCVLKCCALCDVTRVFLFPLLTPEFVFRESFRTFRELSEIFSDDNNYSLSRELLVKVGSNSTQKNTLAAKSHQTYPPKNHLLSFL